MTKTLVEQYVEDPIHMRLFQQERAIYEVTELLEDLMRELGVSRSELAQRLGKTKGWVTQLLDGEANKTVRTVADAFAVLGCEYHSFAKPIQVSNKAAHVTVEPKASISESTRRVSPGQGQVIRLWRPEERPEPSCDVNLELEELVG